jgi:endoglucanase
VIPFISFFHGLAKKLLSFYFLDNNALNLAFLSLFCSEKVMIILDNHMSDAGWCCDPRDNNGLWFNDRFPVESFEKAWVLMVTRYKEEPYVIGADLRNVRPFKFIFLIIHL